METTWGRWCGLGLMALLALIGLTDAATPKPRIEPVKSVTVPAGTVWQYGVDEDNATDTALPKIEREYDISGVLARIQQDEPKASSDLFICDTIQCYCGIFPWTNGKPQTDDCRIQGERLIVSATETNHQTILALLSHWQKFGQRQITVEVNFCSTEKDLSDFLPTSGGKIVSPSPSRETDLLSHTISPHDIQHSLSSPSFVRILSPAEQVNVKNHMQNEPRASIMFAPKVTLFSGSSAVVKDIKQRPFVTGLRATESGLREPQVSKVSEGVQIGFSSALLDDDGNIRLNLQVRDSELLDVEVLKTRIANQRDDAIQIPHLRESNLKATMTLASGHSMLVSPLRRDKNGKLLIYLITPRLLDVQ